MLVLKRKEGQWVDVIHRSGDRMRIRVYNIRSQVPRQLDLAFDDDARHFTIERPERNLPALDSTRADAAEVGAIPAPHLV
ncbi:hypothetical protein EP7_002881 [Isosphaeraceae bacterium EP7]